MSQIQSAWTDIDYLEWVSQPDIFYLINYINVTVLTVVVIVLFTVLFNYLSERNKTLAILGIVFIPIYGVLNLTCYSIQISVVPLMAAKSLNTSNDALFVVELIQAINHSSIGFINGLAYAVLGITSIIYGYMLMKRAKKVSGSLLLLNGVLCIIGFVGYILQNKVLSTGVLLGGIVFLLSLIFIVIDFNKSRD
ncbi:MAG: hypothetical protein FWE27_08580 [Defluviitaleaceae bacterium]|nr:hypothetical protein [Defluviitaleaceae bacterium]